MPQFSLSTFECIISFPGPHSLYIPITSSWTIFSSWRQEAGQRDFRRMWRAKCRWGIFVSFKSLEWHTTPRRCVLAPSKSKMQPTSEEKEPSFDRVRISHPFVEWHLFARVAASQSCSNRREQVIHSESHETNSYNELEFFIFLVWV